MKYAKIQDGEITFFRGRILHHNGMVYANPTEKQLKKAGFLPFEEENIPAAEEDQMLSPIYTEEEGRIVRRMIAVPRASV